MPANTAVLIAAYNAAATLDRAIASALAQPETAEVCVVDDCSRDATAEIAEAWRARDARVIVVNQRFNAGPAAARNAAIEATTAPWLTILDADDFLLPGRLTTLQAHGAADFVADRLIRVPEGAPAPAFTIVNEPAHELSFEAFVLGNTGGVRGPLDLGFIKPLFSRAFVAQHRLRYREEMRLGEDYEFYARALALGARFLVTAPAGYVSVEREGSLSKAHSEADLRHLRDCDDALRTIRPLAPQERRALDRHWRHVDCRLQWRRLISAVKARDTRAALSAFHTPASSVYLAARLAEQAWRRSLRALGATPASAH
ncbi:glycosyltransferase family 2 protein [Terricaulis sp.]|uniref:glycosyltransferase family 2 protein n=1 Tax=Terricaulis sp. TaxID=2768686 RepID=UPI0037833D1F